MGHLQMNPLVFNSWAFSFYQDSVESHSIAISEENDSYSPKEGLFLLQNPGQPCFILPYESLSHNLEEQPNLPQKICVPLHLPVYKTCKVFSCFENTTESIILYSKLRTF